MAICCAIATMGEATAASRGPQVRGRRWAAAGISSKCSPGSGFEAHRSISGTDHHAVNIRHHFLPVQMPQRSCGMRGASMNDIEWTGFQQFLFSRAPWRFVMLGGLLVMVVNPAVSRADWFLKCNQRERYPEYCCWTGTAPVCTAGCPSGYYEERRSKNADGDLSTCWAIHLTRPSRMLLLLCTLCSIFTSTIGGTVWENF